MPLQDERAAIGAKFSSLEIDLEFRATNFTMQFGGEPVRFWILERLVVIPAAAAKRSMQGAKLLAIPRIAATLSTHSYGRRAAR